MKHPVAIFILLFICQSPRAETDWISATIDNDIFVGDDSGYTNGFYFSWYDVEPDKDKLDPPLLVRPMLWSLSSKQTEGAVNSYTIGQAIITPKDITAKQLAETYLPYSGLLFINSTRLEINKNYADKLSSTIGIVGPSSGAKATQKWVHDIIGADEPKGWNSQIKDEIVFKFTRARVWRAWTTKSGYTDLLFNGEAALGTIESSVSNGLILRYGRDLMQSYATSLFSSTKTSNPAAINGGWYIYASLTGRYVFNQIFTDGNTFRNSPSIDYEKGQLSVGVGWAYSWQNISVTLAINDSDVIDDGVTAELQELMRYGTLTVAWRY